MKPERVAKVGAAAQSARIAVSALSKSFGSYQALRGIDLEIRSNEFFTLLGPSGCGKTTLLRTLAGFESPNSGDITLDGQSILALPPHSRPVNTVFQNYALFPHMTVTQNVGFGLKMLGRPRAEIAATVAEMLELVRMTELAGRSVGQLSGGQQQRVALARALAPRPKVLLLDEPLSALDLKLRQTMQIELKRLQRETGITFIFVTHDQEEALTMSDRIAVMSAGCVLQTGTPVEIYERPANRFVADFIGETNFIPGRLLREGQALAFDCEGLGQIGLAVPADRLPAAARTLAVRPEQLDLERESGPDRLPGVVETIVYFGTDSYVHVRLANGLKLVVRTQNSSDRLRSLGEGSPTWVRIPADRVQLLED